MPTILALMFILAKKNQEPNTSIVKYHPSSFYERNAIYHSYVEMIQGSIILLGQAPGLALLAYNSIFQFEGLFIMIHEERYQSMPDIF